MGNCSLTTLADHAIMAVGSAVAQLTNLVVTANLTGLLAAESSSVYVLNSSMPDPTVLGLATVKVGWHIRVQVQNASNQPAPGAQVNVSDASGTQHLVEVTDSSGSTRLLPVVEKVLNSTGVATAFGPFSVTGWSSTGGRAHLSVNVTRYTAVGIRLDPQAPATTVELKGDLRPSGWYWGEVEVTLRAADDRAEGVLLHYRTGAGPWQVERGMGLSASLVWNLGTEGVTAIEFFAEDGAGNVGSTGSTAIKIDSNAPRVTVTPLPQTLLVPEIDLEWSGEDGNGSGVDYYSVNVSFNGRFIPGLENARVTSWHVDASDGTYVFRVSAVDRAGRTLQNPQTVTVTVALNGALRFSPLDAAGNGVGNVSVWVDGRKVAENVSGTVELNDLLAGQVTVVVEAPGFVNLVLNATVKAHDTTDLGNVTLQRVEGPAPATDLTLGFVVLALLLLVTTAYGVRMRLKWRKRK
jgi:hypothetical protein